MTLQDLSGQDQLLLSSKGSEIMRFVTARCASRYASGTAGLWIRTRSCRTCSSWTLVVYMRDDVKWLPVSESWSYDHFSRDIAPTEQSSTPHCFQRPEHRKTQHFNSMAFVGFALVTLGLSCWFLQVFRLAHLQSSVDISRSGPTLSPRIKAFASSADWRQTICKENLKNYRDPQTIRISVRSTVVEFNRSQRILWNQIVGTPDISQLTLTVPTSTRKHQPAGNWFPCYLSELP